MVVRRRRNPYRNLISRDISDRFLVLLGSVYMTDGGTTTESGVNYTTSLVGNTSLNWVEEVVSSGKDHPPFFVFIGPHSPHLPSTPAPWYCEFLSKWPHF